MKIYETVDDYMNDFKKGDIIVFGGVGILDGLESVQYKFDTYKTVGVIENSKNSSLIFREYRGRTNLSTSKHGQRVGVLTKAEFNNLKTD